MRVHILALRAHICVRIMHVRIHAHVCVYIRVHILALRAHICVRVLYTHVVYAHIYSHYVLVCVHIHVHPTDAQPFADGYARVFALRAHITRIQN